MKVEERLFLSICTDVASLKIMAHIYKRKNLHSIFTKTVESLIEHVPYIDWVGIYLYEDSKLNVVAASDFENDLHWECNGELKFPLSNSSGEAIGMIIVRSLQAIAFDVTDVSTLETVAKAIGEESFFN